MRTHTCAMLNAKSFLALDLGASTLKVGAFEPNEAGGLRLSFYAFRALGPDAMQESTREAAIQKALQEVLAESGTGSKQANVCAPGFHVFSKFVKLPPVDNSKVPQIIQYEAQQNVPFPLEEVVWDYQILGATPTGELEVLLVAIKSEIVEGLFRTTEHAGLKLGVVDVSPAALANAFRYNYGDLEGCTMLLDIGAKTSNLLFFDKDNIYARGINIGANSITVDFAKESKLSFDAAEELKISQGFVSLGGAYEEPDDPAQQAISKIARQVMTRLHIQVNQTIQFYRGQQGGAAPVRLFLSGGASAMPYTAQFFAEKLNLPVEYFNPLRNVQIDPAVNIEELAKVGHQMGELVGLGLRNLAHCPVELNLMPKSAVKGREFGAKKPYLIATMACVVAIIWAYGFFYNKIAESKTASRDRLLGEVSRFKTTKDKLDREIKQLTVAQAQAEQYIEWLNDKPYWGNVLTNFRSVLIATERKAHEQFNVDAGVWVERFVPDCSGEATGGGAPPPQFNPPPRGRGGRFGGPGGGGPMDGGGPGGFGGRGGRGGPGAGGGTGPGVGMPCHTVTLLVRAVDMVQRTGKADANQNLAFLLENELKANAMFVSTNTGFPPGGSVVPDGNTFTFQMHVTLKNPLKL
ncbi:MAG TPA: type IV pilus assembly protein PilM [Candidatus Acidoferrum sp.]|nr:type IV pilus assembly protein PilM [Candidatus Acidoferrum sp.]